jgi:very-short-patch-repair endonuclease
MDGPKRTKQFARTLRRDLSLPEAMLWRRIRGRQLDGLYFRRQHPLGRYVLDFYCNAARLAVEIDGAYHADGDKPERDRERDAWCASQGIETLRIPALEVLAAPGRCVTLIEQTARRRLTMVAGRKSIRRRGEG